MPFPKHPILYEINTRVWLKSQNKRLAEIPTEYWQGLKNKGFDLIWLMGIWTPSPSAQVIAQNHPDLKPEYSLVLPDWTEQDIGGSPYAVGDYVPNPAIATHDELLAFKQQLEAMGLGLILDFVPNHTAIDHPWVTLHPEYFVTRPPHSKIPDRYFVPRFLEAIAYGRDPNYEPWTDTAQLNYFNPDTRTAMTEVLKSLQQYCHGVRCDMAMLILNDVFCDTWSNKEPCLEKNTKPVTEFWSEAIGTIKQTDPHFMFIAEAYWDLENTLTKLGFDFTYDKKLYDYLKHDQAWEVTPHLGNQSNPHQWVRFLENHDETRAALSFGEVRLPAAAWTTLAAPGLKLIHDGQLEGKEIKLPVQLARTPEESPRAAIQAIYQRLLEIINQPVFKSGRWELVHTTAVSPDNQSLVNLVTFHWNIDSEHWLIVTNPGAFEAQGFIQIQDWQGLPETLTLEDVWNQKTYTYPRTDLQDRGLYVHLPPHQVHVFKMINGQ